MKIKKIPIYISQLITGKRRIHISFENNIENDKNKFAIDLLTTKYPDLEKNTQVYKKLVGIDGICACSGSSAITDFLGEFSSCTSIGGVDSKENPGRGSDNTFEVDFFRDAHGVYELEKICDFDCNRICGGAITDFIELVEQNTKVCKHFYNQQYLKSTQDFLLNILDLFFTWDKVTNCFYVKKLSKEQYRQIAKKYLLSILENIPSKETLVLDNLLSITNPKDDVLTQYFGQYKLLLSIRDPRDVYTTARSYPTFDLGYIPKDPYDFVKYYKWYLARNNFKDNPNTMIVQFEDFVSNYDDVSKRIMQFVDLKEDEHVSKFAYFNPEISKNNIGIYKTYKDQDAIRIIEKELSDYLYN